jgi:hypothetical protein
MPNDNEDLGTKETSYTIGRNVNYYGKTVWRLLKKITNRSTNSIFVPTISRLGICLKECKSDYNENNCTPKFIEALFTIAKLWK